MATSSGFSTFPIRAPLTLDSDSDGSLPSNGLKYDNNSGGSTYDSDVSGFESEGGLSGEDELESASGRPFVADPDDDLGEYSDFDSKDGVFRPFDDNTIGNKNGVSVPRAYVVGTSSESESETTSRRHSVTDPDDDLAENDTFVSNDVAFRPVVKDSEYGMSRATVASASRASVTYPPNDIAKSGNVVGDQRVSRPFLSESDEEDNEHSVSMAFVAGKSGEGASVRSIKGNKIGDSDAHPDNVSEESVVSKPSVNASGTSEEGTIVKSTQDDKYEDFGSNPDENLNENGKFVVRSFANNPSGIIKDNGVSGAYRADADVDETRSVSIKASKNGDFGKSSIADIGISAIQTLSIPIAKVSRESDDESLSLDDTGDGEFWGSVRIVNSHSLEKTESVIKASKEEEVEAGEEMESKIEPESEDKLLENPEISEFFAQNMYLQGDEGVASGADSTCFLEETKGAISPTIIGAISYSVSGSDNKSNWRDVVKDSKLVEISSMESVEKNKYGAEIEDGLEKSYDILDRFLESALDLENSRELRDKEGYEKFHSERSFSIDDYSYGSIIDDLEQTPSPFTLDESSKDFWLKTEGMLVEKFNDDVDTCGESKGDEASKNTNLSKQMRENIENIEPLKAKFSGLVQRLGLSSEDLIASQVLYQLNIIERGPSNQLFTSLNTTMELKCENGRVGSDFSLNILVIGKTGAGKSATINSLLNKEKAFVSAFEPATTCVKEINGMVEGIKVKIFDTPGLRPSQKDQSVNQKVFSSVKRLIRKCPPDIVLYVDRLDMGKGDYNDLQLVSSVTKFLGSSIWKKVIITLTHAGSSPPDGPNGLPLSYDLYVAQRLHNIELMISQSLGHNMFSLSSVGSVFLVENHGDNGKKWRLRLLLLCSSMKILSEANLVAKNQDFFGDGKGFSTKVDSLDVSSSSHSNTSYEDEDDQYLRFNPLTKAQDKDFPDSLNQSSDVLTWRGGIKWSGNLESRVLLAQGWKMVFEAGLNDMLHGKVSVKISGLEQLQLLLLGIASIANAITRK